MLKKITKLSNKINFSGLLALFIILLVILDNAILYHMNFNIFGISLPSLIILIFFVMFCFFLIINGKVKYKKYLSIYIISFITYIFFHFYFSYNWSVFFKNDFGFNIKEEFIYLFSSLMPLFVIYIGICLNIKEKLIMKSLIISTTLIVLLILITNIFKISIGSYTDIIISGNLFDWYTLKYKFYEVASRAFFINANEIVATLLLLTPIIFYHYITKENNIFYGILLFFIMLGGTIVGTRIGYYGLLLLFVILLIYYFYFSLVKKEILFKKERFFSIILILFFFLSIYTITPNYLRKISNGGLIEPNGTGEGIKNIKIMDISQIDFDNDYYINLKTNVLLAIESANVINIKQEELITEFKKDILNTTNKVEVYRITINFIANNYHYYNLSFSLIKNYNYSYDPLFWITSMFQQEKMNDGNRLQQLLVLDRIMKIDDNIYDSLFGLSYTRVNNIHNVEMDFVNQYYILGFFGLTLLYLPYIFIVVCAFIKMIRHKKNKFNFYNIILLTSSTVFMFSAYNSGNTLRFPTIFYLVVVEILLVKNVFLKKERDNYV